MKQRGGSVMDAPTVLYIVVFIAVLNVIAFGTANDWTSIIFMALAGGATFAVKPDLTFALVVGIVASNLYRATSGVHEGMTDKKDEKIKGKETSDVLSSLESVDLGTLMKQQSRLMESIKNMGPLMQSAKEALSQIPPDFLEKAVKNIKL